RVAEDDGRLPLPAEPVRGVERVDVEAASVAIFGSARALDGVEAVDRHSAVAQAPEEVVCLAVEGPVGVDLERGERSRPVRDVELPRGLPRCVGRVAAMWKLRLPLL